MQPREYRYREEYRGQSIFIYGAEGEWMWQAVIEGKASGVSGCCFTVKAAVNEAKRYIDKKVL